PACEDEETLHVPLFFHVLRRRGGTPAFTSGPFSAASLPFEVTFGVEGTSAYHCEIHQQMQGTVTISVGEAQEGTVAIDDADPMNMKIDALEDRIPPGGNVP